MMNKTRKDTYKSAIVTVLSSLSVPLSNLISQIFKSIESPNQNDQISQQDLSFLSRSILFDSSIDCLIDRCVTFLLIDPGECFPILFSNLPMINLDPNPHFSKEKQNSKLLTRLESEFRNPTLLVRSVAFFVIDKLFITIFLRFFEKYDKESNADLSSIFVKFFFSFVGPQQTNNFSKSVSSRHDLQKNEMIKKNADIKRKNELIIRDINIKGWMRVIHILSNVEPIGSSLFFANFFSNFNKSKFEWTFSFNLFRCFNFCCLSDSDIDAIMDRPIMDDVIKPCFQRVSSLNDIQISISIFLMNLIVHEIIIKKKPITKTVKEILKYVNDNFSMTPVALPIAAVFVNYSNLQEKNKKTELNITFSVNQIVTQALTMLISVSGSSILILNTLSQLFQYNRNFFNDIYANGIQIPSTFSEYTLITNERRNNIIQKITSYGSYNNSLLELTNFFVSFALLDFHSFVEVNLKLLMTPVFLRFNSFSAFYFFREILLNENIKKNYSDDFLVFQENILNTLTNHISHNPPLTKDSLIYSLNPWIFEEKKKGGFEEKVDEIGFEFLSEFEKQSSNHNFFIDRLFEFIEPNSVLFPSIPNNIKNDVLLWSKMCYKKVADLFSDEKKQQQINNCKMLKENQSTALLISLIPLLKADEKIILSIVPYLFDFSAQISANSVFIIQLAIRNDPSLIEKVLDLMMDREFDNFEILYNSFYFISIFIKAAFSSGKGINVNSIFIKIQQLLIIGLCSNRNEIRNVVFTIINLLNVDEFKVLFDDRCFKQFSFKLKAISLPTSHNLDISELPFRSYSDIATTKYETIHSIYLSVIFSHLTINFEDDELKMIRNLYSKLKLKKDNVEYKHFYINVISFLAAVGDNDDGIHIPNKLYIEINNFCDNQQLLICFASTFSDVISLTNYFMTNLSFDMQLSLFPAIALIMWERFPNDNTINSLLNSISNIIEKGLNDNLQASLSILILFSKMFSSFAKRHKTLTTSIFLRCSVCEDVFRFCHCIEKEELIFKFCLNSANSFDLKKEGEEALEAFCSVTSLYKRQLVHFDDLKKFPKALRAIFCQSPQCIEFLFYTIKADSSSLSTISALFHPISSILDSTENITENLNLLYYNFSVENKDVSFEILNDIDFCNVIYNLAGKIIATCLWNFPSSDSINTLLNMTLSFALIRIFLNNKKNKDEETIEKVDDDIQNFASLIHFLNNPSNDIQFLSNLLCLSFEFCLDQFLKESFDLLNKSFSSNFVLALTPWMKKVDLNLKKRSDSLSMNTETCFRFCFTSLTFVETIDKFKLYELIDIIINLNRESVESLFIIGINLRKSELILRVLKNAPECFDLIFPYFSCSFWRYQVVQLRKLGDQIYDEKTIQFLAISSESFSKNSIDGQIDDNEEIFDVTYFLLKEVIPSLITDNFNELDFIFGRNLKNSHIDENEEDIDNDILSKTSSDSLTNFSSISMKSLTDISKLNAFKVKSILDHVLTFCIVFEKDEIVRNFLNDFSNIWHFFEFNEKTFKLLFEWATVCGDIDASNSAASYLVDHFDSFSIESLSAYFDEIIKKIIQTVTILTLSIHSRNTTKSTQITGDHQFCYTPYYNYMSSLFTILSNFDLKYDQKTSEKNSKENSEGSEKIVNSMNCVNSDAFWFLCEFLVATDRDFGTIFTVVVDSLYKHVIKNLPITALSSISPHSFEGIFSLIVKNDSVISKKDGFDIIEQIIEMTKVLFLNDRLYHLVGDLNRFSSNNDMLGEIEKKKKYVATAGLFIVPFADCEAKSDTFLEKVAETLGDDKTELNSIQKVYEALLGNCQIDLIETVLQFYLVVVKNDSSRVKDVLDACTRILNCRNLSLDCSSTNVETTRTGKSIILRTNSNSASTNTNTNTSANTNTNTNTSANTNANSNSSTNSNENTSANTNANESASASVNANTVLNVSASVVDNSLMIKIHKNCFLRLVHIALRDKDTPNSLSACSFIQLFHRLGGSFETYQVSSQVSSKFPVENLPFDLDAAFDAASHAKKRSKKKFLSSQQEEVIQPNVQLLDRTTSFSFNGIDPLKKELFEDDEEDTFCESSGATVYFPTDSEFVVLNFVSDIQEAACARSKIEPFTGWNEQISNAENASQKIRMIGSLSLFDDFSTNNVSSDFNKILSEKLNSTEKVVDVCNKFRQFVKESLFYQPHKKESSHQIELFESIQKVEKEEKSKISQSFDESLSSIHETNVQKTENKALNDSLFFMNPLLFTPNGKDIDAMGSSSFPTVFP